MSCVSRVHNMRPLLTPPLVGRLPSLPPPLQLLPRLAVLALPRLPAGGLLRSQEGSCGRPRSQPAGTSRSWHPFSTSRRPCSPAAPPHHQPTPQGAAPAPAGGSQCRAARRHHPPSSPPGITAPPKQARSSLMPGDVTGSGVGNTPHARWGQVGGWEHSPRTCQGAPPERLQSGYRAASGQRRLEGRKRWQQAGKAVHAEEGGEGKAAVGGRRRGVYRRGWVGQEVLDRSRESTPGCAGVIHSGHTLHRGRGAAQPSRCQGFCWGAGATGLAGGAAKGGLLLLLQLVGGAAAFGRLGPPATRRRCAADGSGPVQTQP